ncbi:MAG: helix-turn-helix domain-containing protein [Actinomycetota bacterium]
MMKEDLEREMQKYLRTSEVARLLHVSSKTITRWAKERKLPYVRTLGGHRRFPAHDIRDLVRRLESEGALALNLD